MKFWRNFTEILNHHSHTDRGSPRELIRPHAKWLPPTIVTRIVDRSGVPRSWISHSGWRFGMRRRGRELGRCPKAYGIIADEDSNRDPAVLRTLTTRGAGSDMAWRWAVARRGARAGRWRWSRAASGAAALVSSSRRSHVHQTSQMGLLLMGDAVFQLVQGLVLHLADPLLGQPIQVSLFCAMGLQPRD